MSQSWKWLRVKAQSETGDGKQKIKGIREEGRKREKRPAVGKQARQDEFAGEERKECHKKRVKEKCKDDREKKNEEMQQLA